MKISVSMRAFFARVSNASVVLTAAMSLFGGSLAFGAAPTPMPPTVPGLNKPVPGMRPDGKPYTLAEKLASAENKGGWRLVQDIMFAPDRKLTADLYLPEHPATARIPAVLMIHGGAWTMGNKSFPGETDLGERLAKHGYAVFSIDYRLIKEGGVYPQSIKDVKDGFGYLVKNADQMGIDKNRIAAFGASVGGMMALLVAYAPSTGPFEPILFKNIKERPKCAVMYCPVTDIRDTELTWVIKYIDDTPWHSPELYVQASPITYVKTAVPTMCIHGTDDVTVAFTQSESLIKALKEAGVEAELVPIQKARHLPFHEEPGPVREIAFARLISFLDSHLKGEAENLGNSEPVQLQSSPSQFSPMQPSR